MAMTSKISNMLTWLVRGTRSLVEYPRKREQAKIREKIDSAKKINTLRRDSWNSCLEEIGEALCHEKFDVLLLDTNILITAAETKRDLEHFRANINILDFCNDICLSPDYGLATELTESQLIEDKYIAAVFYGFIEEVGRDDCMPFKSDNPYKIHDTGFEDVRSLMLIMAASRHGIKLHILASQLNELANKKRNGDDKERFQVRNAQKLLEELQKGNGLILIGNVQAKESYADPEIINVSKDLIRKNLRPLVVTEDRDLRIRLRAENVPCRALDDFHSVYGLRYDWF